MWHTQFVGHILWTAVIGSWKAVRGWWTLTHVYELIVNEQPSINKSSSIVKESGINKKLDEYLVKKHFG